MDCLAVDSCYRWEALDEDSAFAAAVCHFNAQALEADRVHVQPGKTMRQKILSHALDRSSLQALWEAGDLHLKAHLKLISREGAAAWLFAMPSKQLGLQLRANLFCISLQRRLRMAIFDSEFFCPMCDEIMDIFADHAIVCACGGDRTKRHNLLRNQTARFCHSFNLRPEIEKPGLLAARMIEEQLDADSGQDGRRPADVFLPCWDLGGSAALDFAVINGLRGDILRDSDFPAASGPSAINAHEDKKRDYLDTAANLAEQGIQFLSLVVDGHSGAWEDTALQSWKKLAKHVTSSK